MMAEAKQFDLWNYAAAVMATLANLQRDPKKGRALKPADFHPMEQAKKQSRRPPLKASIQLLKTVFVDNQPGGAR